ncbi:MAG TPA: hypothetical protein VJU61_11225 [Polyangiaceae bacterium]|nr:hypothetical protein [Polyangiaceae bacterium]
MSFDGVEKSMTNRPIYSIYVVELGASALDDPKFDHPHRDRDKPCLYVGSTAKAIEERYDDHQVGSWTQSRAAQKHGVKRLRPDLAQGKYAYSRDKAVEIEARLADTLRSQGYGVSQH